MPEQTNPVFEQPVMDESGKFFTLPWYNFFQWTGKALADVLSAISSGTGTVQVAYVLEQVLTGGTTTTIASPIPSPVMGSTLAAFVDQDATGGNDIAWDSTFETDTPVQIDSTGLSKNSFYFVATSSNKWRLVGLWQPTV